MRNRSSSSSLRLLPAAQHRRSASHRVAFFFFLCRDDDDGDNEYSSTEYSVQYSVGVLRYLVPVPAGTTDSYRSTVPGTPSPYPGTPSRYSDENSEYSVAVTGTWYGVLRVLLLWPYLVTAGTRRSTRLLLQHCEYLLLGVLSFCFLDFYSLRACPPQ